MRNLFLILFTGTMISACSVNKEKQVHEKKDISKNTTIEAEAKSQVNEQLQDDLFGYDELSNADSLDGFMISAYNTDIEEIPNIKRPAKSKIINSVIPPDKLFGIWVQDPGPDEPHATFELSPKSFFIVDYDGDGDMPYEINGDQLTVYFNDFIKKGRLIKSEEPERLIIQWEDSGRPTIYYTWKN